MVNWKTVYSVLAGLLIWDAVYYVTLGTSPVLGNFLGAVAETSSNGSGNSNNNVV
jgi:ABC-type sulfate transport system permease subunit